MRHRTDVRVTVVTQPAVQLSGIWLCRRSSRMHWRARVQAMHTQHFYFGYFWLSHRPADGEASANV